MPNIWKLRLKCCYVLYVVVQLWIVYMYVYWYRYTCRGCLNVRWLLMKYVFHLPPHNSVNVKKKHNCAVQVAECCYVQGLFVYPMLLGWILADRAQQCNFRWCRETKKKTVNSSHIGFAVIREFLGVYLLVLKSERDRGIHNLQYTGVKFTKSFFFCTPWLAGIFHNIQSAA